VTTQLHLIIIIIISSSSISSSGSSSSINSSGSSSSSSSSSYSSSNSSSSSSNSNSSICLKSVLRHEFYILDTYFLNSLTQREQECDDPWLFSEAKRVLRRKSFCETLAKKM